MEPQEVSAALSHSNTLGFISSTPSLSGSAGFRLADPRNAWALRPLVNAALNALLRPTPSTSAFVPSGVFGVPEAILEAAVPVAVAKVKTQAAAVMTSAQMAADIVDQMDFPITALSDALDIERKTIYDWFKGAEAGDANSKRLRVLWNAFQNEPAGAMRFYHRLWKRTLENGQDLRSVLTASQLDQAAIKAAMDELRPAVLSSMSSNGKTGVLRLSSERAADSLNDYLEVGERS